MKITLLILIFLPLKLLADDFMSPYFLPDSLKTKPRTAVKVSDDKKETASDAKKEDTKKKETSKEDEKEKKKKKEDFVPLRKPTRALFQSLILPGWGQYYNDKKVKACIFLGMEVFLITGIIYNAIRAHDNYSLSQEAANRNDQNNADYYYNRYLSFYRRREDFIWYKVAWALVAMADAYVDAYMHGFDSDIDIGIYDKQPQKRVKFFFNNNNIGFSFTF
ncbi:MAG: hypothetical protein JXA60_07050 [Candidatus Coatesbacteria bacterium]|nr:hypothetical protein [Candidatus Coatesbacteria bacterium]